MKTWRGQQYFTNLEVVLLDDFVEGHTNVGHAENGASSDL